MPQKRIEQANPCGKLTNDETKRLNELETIAEKLKRGENMPNRQLQAWLSDDEYAQLDMEWRAHYGFKRLYRIIKFIRGKLCS